MRKRSVVTRSFEQRRQRAKQYLSDKNRRKQVAEDVERNRIVKEQGAIERKRLIEIYN